MTAARTAGLAAVCKVMLYIKSVFYCFVRVYLYHKANEEAYKPCITLVFSNARRVFICLVPGPQYYASVICFGSSGPGRKSRSIEIRHRNQLTAKAWEKAVQELGRFFITV